MITEIDMEKQDFTPNKDIDHIFRSRVLKPNCIADYDGDELDYLIVYDVVSDIITRYDKTTFVAAMQIQRLEIPGIAERIMFDVLLSDYFQLPHPQVHHLHYIVVACIMRKRLPIQALNLLIKQMPRMDQEIRMRFETFYALIMNHIDFQLNFDVLKKITNKESVHYKCVQDLFKRMKVFTFKLPELLKEKNMPSDWVIEGYGDPIFIHGEDEEDIKKIVEKIKFKDESKDELEELINGEDLEAKEEALEEVIFEAFFRKANRNYSFMQKVLDTYDSTLQNALKDKKNVVKMMYNMFKDTPEKFITFTDMFISHKIIETQHVTEWLLENDSLEGNHFFVLSQIMKITMEKGEYQNAVKIFDDMKKILDKSEGKTGNDYIMSMLRKHRDELEQNGHFADVEKMYEDTEILKAIVS